MKIHLIVLISVQKVSVDGQSHGDLLLIAIGSGTILAIIIMIILMTLIKQQTTSSSNETKKQIHENFTFSSSSDSGIPSTSQKSNLMFKYFGKSLSSFDLDKDSSDRPTQISSSSCINFVSINIDDNHRKDRFNKNNIWTPSDFGKQSKYIQTISC